MSGHRIAFVFPGQGSQAVGMGRDWADSFPAAAAVFEQADSALGESLSDLCWNGPEEELQLTENTQPAILTASLAVHAVLAERGIKPIAVAGHSLGEYSALVAAGTLALEDAVRLVRERGRLMQEAVPVGKGAMAAILGLDREAVAEAVMVGAESGVCAIANINSPQQLVIAGAVDAVRIAVEKAGELGARRAVEIPVSAPFHCPLMAPAREGLTPVLEQTPFADANVPVVTNVDAAPTQDAAVLRDALVRQVDGTVRWVECVEALLSSGATTLVEVGPGNVLTGLLRRIDRSVKGIALSNPDNLEKLLNHQPPD